MRKEEGVFRQSGRSHRKTIDMATGAAPGRYTEPQPLEETPAVKPDQGSGSTTTSQQVPSEKQRGLLKRAMQVWRTLSSQGLLFFAAVVVIIAAWQALKPVTVIAPFQVPDKGSVPFSGETVANVLQDHLVQIHQRIQNQNKDQKLHATDMHSLGQAGLQIPPDIKGEEYSRSEVPTQFAVEVKGLSYQALVGSARAIWGTQTTITGDMIVDGRNGGKFTLIARTAGKGPWQTDPQPQTVEGLQLAAEDLAEKIIESREPGTAGVLFLNDGKAQRALEALKKASEPDPTRSKEDEERVRVALCVGMEANEQYRAAMDCYRDLLNKKPSSPEEIEERFAQAHWLAGDDPNEITIGKSRDDALQEFDILANKKRYSRALLGWGKALDDLGRHDPAVVAYSRFLENENNLAEKDKDRRNVAIAHVGKATAYAHMGNHKDARAQYEEALKSIPGDTLVLVRRGVELADAGDLDAGITELQKAVDERKESGDVEAFASYQLGILFERRKEWGKASEQYRKTVEKRPEFSEGHMALAKALAQDGKIEDSRNEFREAARRSSKEKDRKYVDVLARQWLGNSLQDLCEFGRAESEYKAAIFLKQDYRAAHSELGRVYARQRQFGRAIEEYEKALDANPNELDEVEWLVRTRVRLGEALVSQGPSTVPDGFAELRAIAMIEPRRVEWLLALGEALREQGNYPEAASTFRKAMGVNAEEADAHYYLAVTLGKMGKAAEAAEQCGIVGKLRPDDPKYRGCPSPVAVRKKTGCAG
jgi:tetratricopeptide (TPR) repeat protein